MEYMYVWHLSFSVLIFMDFFFKIGSLLKIAVHKNENTILEILLVLKYIRFCL